MADAEKAARPAPHQHEEAVAQLAIRHRLIGHRFSTASY